MNYKIIEGNLPAVICYLNPGEKLVTERGSMAWMSPNMQMETSAKGGVGKALERMVTRESIFQNTYTAKDGNGMISFASSFPGSIMAVEITPERPILCQKSAFLAGQENVKVSAFLQKKIGAGLFGGEGFIMQKIEGNGLVFLEIDGAAVQYDLAAGQELVIDTGYLAMADASCTIDIRTISGIKNVLVGGEGIFNTVVRGPGKVIVQTMPLIKFVDTIFPLISRRN